MKYLNLKLYIWTIVVLNYVACAKRLGEMSNNSKADQVARRKLQTSLLFLGNQGVPDYVFPLGLCEGDCDRDDECETGLECFQRSDTEEVPGCEGIGIPGLDYCYNPNIQLMDNTTVEAVDNSTNVATSSSNLNTTVEAAYNSTNVTSLNLTLSDFFPLGKCKGDCDEDSDCQGDLQCFRRDELQGIPGCSGLGEERKDYCYDPADDSFQGSSTIFRLKLFWKEGYYWQKESFERKWCLDCGLSVCRLHMCSTTSTRFEFVEQSVGYLIMIANTTNCLQYMEDHDISVETCSTFNSRQLWTGNFSATQFEISPIDNTERCADIEHHPRDTEAIAAHRCEAARGWTTSNWNKY